MSGMDDNEDDHNFSDDEFDTLPVNTLFELEQNAILSTQRPAETISRKNKQQSLSANHYGLPPKARQPVLQQDHAQNGYQQPQPRQEYSQSAANAYDGPIYQDEAVATPVDEEATFIPQDLPGEMTLREEWRRERFGGPADLEPQRNPSPAWHTTYQNYRQPRQQEDETLGESYDTGMQKPLLTDGRPFERIGVVRSAEEEALRSQVEELLRERDNLTAKLHTVEGTLLTQRGEIAIIRANQNKESKVYDRQLAAFKKSAQEEAVKHKINVEAMHAESRKLLDENKFLKHELDEETDKSKSLQRTLNQQPSGNRAEQSTTTPQKHLVHSLRDGFEDGELMIVSPSKSGRRSKGGTPTAGNKRKRKVDLKSPIAPLILRQSGVPAPPPETSGTAQSKADRIVPIIRKDTTAEKNLQFVQRILNHSIAGEKDRIVESFMNFALPSAPSKTFTSILLEATVRLSGDRLPAKYLAFFVDLWARALKEKYYVCLTSLMEVIDFMVNLEVSVIDAEALWALLPVLQSTAEINARVRFEHSPVSQQSFGQFRQTPKSELESEVPERACLEMLYNIACICMSDDKLIDTFWRSMTSSFVLMMLNSSQPVPDMALMLNLLSTSILPNTFAIIGDIEDEQRKVESYIIDRICCLLWETPRVDEGVTPHTRSEICEHRLEAMMLLNHLAIGSSTHPHNDPPHHGSLIIALQPRAIARLVRSIYDEVDNLYAHYSSHSLHAELVNQGINLLYHLLKTHGEKIDMQQKLLALNGGVHKHRVVLTRLAFSDCMWLDEGISEETVDMATDMLEESVTPEEAEMLVEAFPGYGGRRRGTQA